MSHYYSKEQNDIKSEEKKISFSILDEKFSFITDNGVFCKDYIDYGSKALINAFKPNSLSLPILDMGCGYGTLGIIISKLYNKEAVMFDVNQRAVTLANKNIALNNANARAYVADILEGIEGAYSACVTNPPIRAGKNVVFKMYEEAYKHLVSDGELFVVIQKKQGAPSSQKYIFELFGNCSAIAKDKGYYILYAKKK